MNRFLSIALRAGIGALVLVGLFGQIIVVPEVVADFGRSLPYGPYTALFVAIGIAGIACVQVAMGAVWMLLAMVDRDAIFTSRAYRWINTIIGASVAAALLSLAAGVNISVAFAGGGSDNFRVIAVWLAALAGIAVGTCFAMLMVVMRGLLRKAADLETEMAEVV
jgi:hypothetical protein